MKTASAISTALHVAVLLWAVITFSGKPFEVTPAESLPVDLVNIEEFNKVTKGVKDAPPPKIEEPKPQPIAEKNEPAKPVEELKPKIDKKEVKTEQQAAPPPPPPEKSDAISEKIKKLDEPKQEAKVEPKPVPPKKPEKQQPKFDADKIAALLDKRTPTRNAAASEEPPSEAPVLGSSSGNNKRLSMTELDALRARLRQCWSPPVGADSNSKLYVVLRVLFKKDGTVSREPTLVEGTASNFGPALADSARRAVLRCQPFTMLKPEHYDLWKDVEIKFDLQEMLGG